MSRTIRIAFPSATVAAIALAGLFLSGPVRAEDKKEAKEAAKVDTVTGEVMDLACYLGHGASGKDHAKCAQTCIKKGLPVGIKTSKGDLLIAMAEDHKPANSLLAPHAGHNVTVAGVMEEKDGVKAIEIQKVVKSD